MKSKTPHGITGLERANVDLLQIGKEENVKKILSPQRRLTKCHFEIASRVGLSRRILKGDFNMW
jgi:hypothetical protein